MPRTCQMTGKKAAVGCNVSHSKRATKRRFEPNLQEKKVLNPATGKTMRVRLSTSALKTLSKWQKEGKKFDLKKLLKY